jgi:hypothetical protein
MYTNSNPLIYADALGLGRGERDFGTITVGGFRGYTLPSVTQRELGIVTYAGLPLTDQCRRSLPQPESLSNDTDTTATIDENGRIYIPNVRHEGTQEYLNRHRDPERLLNTLEFGAAILLPEHYLLSSSIYHSATGDPGTAALELGLFGLGRILAGASSVAASSGSKRVASKLGSSAPRDLGAAAFRESSSVADQIDALFYEAAKPYLSEGAWAHITNLARKNHTPLMQEAAVYFNEGAKERVGSIFIGLVREKAPRVAEFLDLL